MHKSRGEGETSLSASLLLYTKAFYALIPRNENKEYLLIIITEFIWDKLKMFISKYINVNKKISLWTNYNAFYIKKWEQNKPKCTHVSASLLTCVYTLKTFFALTPQYDQGSL